MDNKVRTNRRINPNVAKKLAQLARRAFAGRLAAKFTRASCHHRAFHPVMPAQAGIQSSEARMDSRFRGNDEGAHWTGYATLG